MNSHLCTVPPGCRLPHCWLEDHRERLVLGGSSHQKVSPPGGETLQLRAVRERIQSQRMSTLDLVAGPEGFTPGLLLLVDCRPAAAGKGDLGVGNPWLLAAMQMASEGLVHLRMAAVMGADGLEGSKGALQQVQLGPDMMPEGRESRGENPPQLSPEEVPAGSSSSQSFARVVRDTDGRWDQAMGATGQGRMVLLVRPDGHVAGRWGCLEASHVDMARRILMSACTGVLAMG